MFLFFTHLSSRGDISAPKHTQNRFKPSIEWQLCQGRKNQRKHISLTKCGHDSITWIISWMTRQQCFPYIHGTKNVQITPRFLKTGIFFFFNNQLANLQFKTFLRIKYDKILIIFCINQCKNRSLVRKLSYLSNPVLFQDVY